jgi:hypothetical protein
MDARARFELGGLPLLAQSDTPSLSLEVVAIRRKHKRSHPLPGADMMRSTCMEISSRLAHVRVGG